MKQVPGYQLPLDLTDKSTLVQVMAWCRQATSHYLSQCWPRSISPNGVTRPQWVNSQQNIIHIRHAVIDLNLSTNFADENKVKSTLTSLISLAFVSPLASFLVRHILKYKMTMINIKIYRKISNIRCAKSENLSDCRLVLQLPLAPTASEWPPIYCQLRCILY